MKKGISLRADLRRRLHDRLVRALDLNDAETAACLTEPVGWCDGGCFGLAVALLAWTKGAAEPVGIFREGEDIMDHGLVRIFLPNLGAAYLDGDGVSTEAELLHRWQFEENIGPCRLETVSLRRLHGAATSDPCVDVDRLVRRLKQELGSAQSWGLERQKEGVSLEP